MLQIRVLNDIYENYRKKKIQSSTNKILPSKEKNSPRPIEKNISATT